MPETSMHEDNLTVTWKHNVRASWKVRSVQSKAVSHPVDKRAHKTFGCRIRPLDLRHDPTAFFLIENIHFIYVLD